MFVFAYGSLLLPASLQSSVPERSWQDCVPALLRGWRRNFGVAFPNDGSQLDKAYIDAAGSRPPVVLFANLCPGGPATSVNGICVPVDGDELRLLAGRELRYDMVDVTSAVHAHPARSSTELDRVVVFVGKRRFTQAHDVAAGLVPARYAASMIAGARFWEEHVPGFHAEFLASTHWPTSDRIVPLTRVVPGGGAAAAERGAAGGPGRR